jgi:hypothetical protein
MGEGTSGTRRSIIITLLTFVLATVAMAAGASVSSHPNAAQPPPPSDSIERVRAESKDAAAAHGGPIERVHRSASCDLTDVDALPANWTHGDYVRAVARSGKDGAVREAALSACGKPVVASTAGGPEGSEHAEGKGPGHGAEVSAEHRASAPPSNGRSADAPAGGPPSDVPGAAAASAAHG